ncbi:hypothetical protein [Pseudomonas sp. TH31]|uniref:hypothetical protein n=1 Tax=Pseudomonas sp. TH31 TaxID=2796396 RepID=UPI0019116CC7|nr:hypothetical protein [Pseudomonas sp. TH31]MBK5417950.1 hypothetical protein [Pseudomonas sp. TH31]
MPKENEIIDPLKIERSTVTKLVITGAPRLDRITVLIEDFGRRDCPTGSNPSDQTDQVRLIGSSVCPDEAEALVRANAADIIELYQRLAA